MQRAPLPWYEAVARGYDLGTLGDWFYQAARRAAVDRLQLGEGDAVLDLFCGTGVDFPLLRRRVGAAGQIVGADGSAAMLRQARPRADRNAVALLRADFSTDAGRDRLTAAARQHGVTAYIFSLGLTCLPAWRTFFAAMYEAAPAGAHFSILDVHADRLTLGAQFLNWIGAAECRRPVWEELQARGEDFQRETRRPFRIFGVEVLPGASIIVASGRKPY